MTSVTTDSDATGPDSAPVCCPHPNECPRLPLKELEGFRDRRTVRWRKLDRYRRFVARECVCNANRVDLKT